MRCQTPVLPVAALAAAAMLFAGTASFAQETEFQPAQLPGWTVTPGVIASLAFDDNVALAPELAAQPAAQGATMLVIEPSGQLAFNGPRTRFDSGYRGYLRRYVNLDELNSFDQRGYGSLHHWLTRRHAIFLTETFMKVPSTDELELNGVPFARIGSKSNTLAGGLDSRLTRQLDFHVRYDLTWVGFDHTQSLLRTGLFHGLQTEVARRVTERSSVGAEYAIRLANLNDGTRSLMFQDAGATFRYETGPQTSVHLAGGFSHLIDRTLSVSRTGPFVRADISHHLQRATLGAGFSREFVPTFGFGGSSESESFRAYITMPISRNRIYLQQSASWRRTNPLIVTSPALDSWWLHSTVGYSMSRWLRAEGFYTFARQDTKIAGGLINRNRIGAQIAIAQPMRIP